MVLQARKVVIYGVIYRIDYLLKGYYSGMNTLNVQDLSLNK